MQSSRRQPKAEWRLQQCMQIHLPMKIVRKVSTIFIKLSYAIRQSLLTEDDAAMMSRVWELGWTDWYINEYWKWCFAWWMVGCMKVFDVLNSHEKVFVIYFLLFLSVCLCLPPPKTSLQILATPDARIKLYASRIWRHDVALRVVECGSSSAAFIQPKHHLHETFPWLSQTRRQTIIAAAAYAQPQPQIWGELRHWLPELSTFGGKSWCSITPGFYSYHLASYEIKITSMQENQVADTHTRARMEDQQTSNIDTQDSTIPSTSTNAATPSASPSPHSKPCTICHTPRDVLIRCQIDESKKWHFVCTGKCWKDVSGGKVDGDATHPEYRYGGMWKNKHEAVSAKIKGKAKDRNRRKDAGKSEGNLTNGGKEDGIWTSDGITIGKRNDFRRVQLREDFGSPKISWTFIGANGDMVSSRVTLYQQNFFFL